LLARLKELMEEQRTNALQVARAAGISPTGVYDILSGKSVTPSHDVLSRIAEALGVDVEYLSGKVHNRSDVGEASQKRILIPVVGIAETGVLRTLSIVADRVRPDPSLPERMVNGPPHPHYPKIPHFALQVGDNSMNNAKPLPLIKGMDVMCIDLLALQAPLESGRLYAVRSMHRGKGETVIRRLQTHKDSFELQAESTHSEYVNEKYPGRLTSDVSKRVHAIGLVYYLQLLIV
jgi:transcriptional regulator with XRE-family HTH domain